jgi:hypothetical protein
MLAALDIYRLHGISALDHKHTSYRDRQLYEVKTELIEKGVILESETGLQLQSLDMEADRSLAKYRLVMPSHFEFSVLTLTSLKILISIYLDVRYSRTPFRIVRTHEELAERAGVALRGVGKALTQLAEHRLLYAKKVWQKATQISLLDPESGVSLYHAAMFYVDRLDKISVPMRYGIVLSRYDPTGKLTMDGGGPMTGYTVNCPFCKAHKKLRFNSTDEDDGWHCFACKAGGDSARLFARISAWPEQDDRRTLAEVFRDAGMTPDTVSYDPFASYEDYADVIDAINTNAPPKGNACQ